MKLQYKIYLFVILEVLLFSFSSYLSPILNGVLLMLVSLFIGIIPLINISTFKESELSVIKSDKHWICFFYTGLLLILSSFFFYAILAKHAVDPIYSDVIPSIKALVLRFLNDQSVYGTPIPFIGYEVPPTYLPFQWSPYIVPELLGIDYRSFAFLLFCGSILIYLTLVYKSNINLIKKIALATAPFFILFLLFYRIEMEFVYTVEITVVAFYLLFIASIFLESSILISIALTLCLLSRYSLILWLPLFFLVLLFQNKKLFWRVSILTSIGLLSFYIIPFLSDDWTIFIKGYDYYTKAALSEWQTQGYQAPGADPMHLFEGIGLSSVFYKFVPGVVEFKLFVLQKAHLILSLLATSILAFFFYVLKRKKIEFNYKLFLLFSFKIYLTVFYSFIQVPYKYLFFVPIFVSIYVLYSLTRLKST